MRRGEFGTGHEADPNEWGILLRTVAVDVVVLDQLCVEACRALVLAAPQPFADALSGAADLFRRARPLIFAGPVSGFDRAALRRSLRANGYRGSLCWPDRGRVDAALLLAVPVDAGVRFDGFDPL